MYQPPKLIELGKAHSLILGIAVTGYDLDGQAMGESFEFAEDKLIQGSERVEAKEAGFRE